MNGIIRNYGHIDLNRRTTKPAKWHVRPAKTQINLGIRPVWSESSLCAQWVVKGPVFLHADNEDFDQTVWMPRLIWIFAERTCLFAGFVMRRFSLLPLCKDKYMHWKLMTGMFKPAPYSVYEIKLLYDNTKNITSQLNNTSVVMRIPVIRGNQTVMQRKSLR